MATSLQRELHYLRVETASHLETKKEGECECLGVKKFKMVRCNCFFVVANGSESGMLAMVMTGWGRGKKQLQMRLGSCARYRNLILWNMNLDPSTQKKWQALKNFKGERVFLIFGEVSKEWTIGLNGRLRFVLLQGIAWDLNPYKQVGNLVL